MSNKILSCLIKKEKNLPIWFMRQAGRYLPEYQSLRKKNKNFINFCKNPKDIQKATLQPIKRFNVDAAIIFSDILLILDAAGQKISFEEKKGPILNNYNKKIFYQQSDKDFKKKLKKTYESIKKTRKKLNKEKALIGFAGAPWTLLVYMINKQSPKKKLEIEKIKNKEKKKIIKRLEHLIYLHCEEQIKSGADIIQLFDSWAGKIKEKEINKFCVIPNANIIKKIKKNYPHIPVICFPKGINKKINLFIKKAKPHAINIDPNMKLKKINIKANVVFQGGLDPKFLLKGEKQMFKKAKEYLDFFKETPYIFNLGHGILPQTKPKTVKRLVEFVRSYKP